MEQSAEWAERVDRTVAQEIRRHRLARGMSAQQLADACERLGFSIPRTVISNIENGRRGKLSLAEVTVLAAALEVPPTVLVFPVGYADQVEYLPGQRLTPLEAADRWHGDPAPEGSALALLRWHRRLEARARSLYRRIWEQTIQDQQWGGPTDGPEAYAAREVAEATTAEIHEVRDEMARQGLALPPLPGLDRPSD